MMEDEEKTGSHLKILLCHPRGLLVRDTSRHKDPKPDALVPKPRRVLVAEGWLDERIEGVVIAAAIDPVRT
jgi:hypothetical protein